MTPLDPDRTLALTYVPTRHRPAVGALWRLDAALGAVLAGGKEPLISQIKLAWWRDSLEKLDTAKAPAEPVLEAVAQHVLPAGVTGAELARMEAGWTALLGQEALTEDELDSYAEGRGALLFAYTARLLRGPTQARVERAGEAWALADLARHSGNRPDAEAAMTAAQARLAERDGRWPASLRPLGMLARLARRDVANGLDAIEPQGAPARMLRMLGHRLTGR